MEEIKLRFIGESPFLMHNVNLANPLDPHAQAIKQKSGKRKKTIEDINELARIEWEGGLYYYKGRVQIPQKMVRKTMERGAVKQKNGTFWKSGSFMEDDFYPLGYPGVRLKLSEDEMEEFGKVIPHPGFNELFALHNFQTMVTISNKKILRARPIFEVWSFDAIILYDNTVIDKDTIMTAGHDAGRLVGMGDWRVEKGGNFGRFRIEEL